MYNDFDGAAADEAAFYAEMERAQAEYEAQLAEAEEGGPHAE